ncbi:MAG: hypothetical protein RIC55_04100 [Pirellulaceae bacterium]
MPDGVFLPADQLSNHFSRERVAMSVDLIISNLWMVPHGLAILFGLVLALVNFSRYPSVSLLAALSLGLMLLNMVGGQLLTVLVLRSDLEPHRIMQILSLARSLLGALALAGLVIAVFLGRRPQRHEAYGAPGKPQDWA